jgi:carbon monoxide dehydrogenase subunit G
METLQESVVLPLGDGGITGNRILVYQFTLVSPGSCTQVDYRQIVQNYGPPAAQLQTKLIGPCTNGRMGAISRAQRRARSHYELS